MLDLPPGVTPGYTLEEALATERAESGEGGGSGSEVSEQAERVRDRLQDKIGADDTALVIPPTAAAVRPGLGTPLPTVPVLVIATPEPDGSPAPENDGADTPVPTMEPTVSAPVVRDGSGAEVEVTAIAAPRSLTLTDEDLRRALDLEPPSCTEGFWSMLDSFEPPEALDFVVVQNLNAQFMESRPDCVEAGWDPEFDDGSTCGFDPSREATLEFPDGLAKILGGPKTSLHLTGASVDPDWQGSLLIHVRRMPFEPGHYGCWYYNSRKSAWGWVSQPPQRNDYYKDPTLRAGAAKLGFEPCNNLLRTLLEAALHLERPEDLDWLYVNGLVQNVRDFAPELCAREWGYPDAYDDNRTFLFWDPQAEPGPGARCRVQADTGVTESGGMLINWRYSSNSPKYVAGGQGLLTHCWILSPDGMWSGGPPLDWK